MKDLVDHLTKKLIDDGKIIEAGWHGLRIAAIPPNASQTQLNEMRKAFFAGAQHLFASIVNVLDPGTEPTDKDLDRMNSIHAELTEFITQLKEEHTQ